MDESDDRSRFGGRLLGRVKAGWRVARGFLKTADGMAAKGRKERKEKERRTIQETVDVHRLGECHLQAQLSFFAFFCG